MAFKAGKIHNEKTTVRYTGTILDAAGDPVTSLDSLKLWLENVDDGATINSRSDQNVLNANNVTFAAGIVTWNLTPDDMAIQDSTKAIEVHRATFYAVWQSGLASLAWEVDIEVSNLAKIT